MRALLSRFPQLSGALPRIDLQVRETPVERWTIGGLTLLAKRDDLSSDIVGGNKVRALELLLAGAEPARRLLTVGASGSTHALAVAEYGRTLGIGCDVITWPQEENAVALALADRLGCIARVTRASSPADAYLRVAIRRLRERLHWVPAGGSVALGALGHVSAALELAAQLEREHIPAPALLVVPLGSGGTTAGLLVGLAIAGLETRVVGVRVVPRVIGNRWHVLRLARQTRALLERLTGVALPPLDAGRLEVEHLAYGGAYGRETDAARHAADQCRASNGPVLDATYSAKAFGVALARARTMPDSSVLFWLTFDGRWIAGSPASSAQGRC